jgi:HEAT repeat protein
VAQALGQLKAGAAGPALRRVIEQESDPRARQAAEKALVALLE